MQQFNDLKNQVLQTLDSNGVLSNIRAEIRHSVFKIINSQETAGGKKPSPFFSQNTKVQKLAASKEGVEQLLLIRELLQFYKMNYSLEIYSAEANLKEAAKRQALWQGLGLPGKPEKGKPILLSLLEKYKEGKEGKDSKKPAGPSKPRVDDGLQEISLDKNPSAKFGNLGESDEFGESRGHDQSVDSLKLEEYDFYEAIDQ